MIRASVFIPAGGSVHASSGEMSAPSQVNFSAIKAIALKLRRQPKGHLGLSSKLSCEFANYEDLNQIRSQLIRRTVYEERECAAVIPVTAEAHNECRIQYST
jgi:hypothetical protein